MLIIRVIPSYMASTSNQLTALSSASPYWDVFLSFYGKDTRRNFTSHLYSALVQAGIQTFMDKPELQKGEEISQGLLNAIKDSKIFVVVLSENYARSPWCLNELVEILCCKRTKNQVVPVFYYVDPSDLRHQKGSFGDALEFHKKRYSVDKIEKWRSALAEIADLSGYHLRKDADENESDTIKKIAENLAPQASSKVLHLDEYLCGIDSAVEEIYQILRMKSNDVRAIGICGMGGIGKTTTAKAFYNRYSNEFEICCFTENAKQNSQGGSPLLPLLNQLLSQLLRRRDYIVHNVESGIRQLKHILCSKKALIVLDGLEQSNYLELELLKGLRNSFSIGSRIIITTKDTNLLNQLSVDISEVDIYMVKELAQKESLELFSYHAFGKPVPPVSFIELSVSFVTYAGGLPLALKVLGSSLRGRKVSFWNAKLEKVKALPEKEIQKILQLSYDELADETEKAIFLDIAFFFVGKDKDEAVHIFNSCGFYPGTGIPILAERCLLTIDKDNKFQMHNLIQDMGRELGKSRFWRGNAWEDLQDLQGADTIEGLILDLTMSTERVMNARIFKSMPKLRLLEMIGVLGFNGNFNCSFNELRCIHWHYCPWNCLPSTLPRKLVSLDMPFGQFKILWNGPMPMVSLKTINASYSMNLESTPDFTGSKLVEKLVLRGCKSLIQVHPSIGHLTILGHLDLSECDHLKELPEPIGRLTVLGHLDMGGCVNLKRSPEPIKQMINLAHLNLARCRKLKRLPDQLGDMKSLKMLDASHTAIELLPDSISCLNDLVKLNLFSCKKLIKLPEEFGNMQGLKRFDASFSAIEQLPDSFGSLTNLVDLHLSNCKNLASLSNSTWNLKFLRDLDVHHCLKLKRLPRPLGNMECLENIHASHTAIQALPDSIGLLHNLQVLDFNWCEELTYLPESIGNLVSLSSLHLRQKDIGRIHLPGTLRNMRLDSLDLSCNIRLWLPMILSFSSLVRLHLTDDCKSPSTGPFSLSKLSNLRYLRLHYCTSLCSSIPELPMNLEELEVYNHASLEQLPDLLSLKKLKSLYIRRCISLQSLSTFPPHLRSLRVDECTSLYDVPDLSLLKNLETLAFVNCSNLESVSLKQSSLQVEGYSSFTADIPNREIAEWFSYKSNGCTLCFYMPPNWGDNFLGVALWVVFQCKTTDRYPYIRAFITNATMGITRNYRFHLLSANIGEEVQSRVECIKAEKILVKSGDLIMVWFESLLYSTYDEGTFGGVEVPAGELKVEMCGAHMIPKTPSRY